MKFKKFKPVILLLIAIAVFFILRMEPIRKICQSCIKSGKALLSARVPILGGDSKASPSTVVIKGLVWNTEIPQAIANGRVVSVGSFISGVKIGDTKEDLKIIDIDQRGITIERADNAILIPMSDPETGEYYESTAISFYKFGRYTLSHKKYK